MRIAFVSTMAAGPWGGSEELWTRIAAQALADGHDVFASVARWRPRAAQIQKLADAGAKLDERLWFRSARVQMTYNRKWKRFAAVRRFKPDIILLSVPESSELGSMLGVRSVGLMTDDFRIPFIALSQAGEEYTVTGGGDEADESRALAIRAAAMWFVSQRNLEVFERMHCLRLPQGEVVRNPVNLPDLTPVPWLAGRPAERPARFCLPGRLSLRAKGHDLLLDVLSREPWPKRSWELTFYGTGPDQGYLQRFADHAHLAGRVRMGGFNSDVRAIWAANDLLVMPSRVEGTPLALVEAMLCGRPAMVSDVGGNTEWISDGRNGFVAAGLTVNSVGEAMERAWAGRDRWPVMGAAARDDALRLYDPAPGRTLLNKLIALAPVSRESSRASAERAVEIKPAEQK